jgi:hypothetical protein
MGRPKSEEGDLGTKHVRIKADLAEMLSEILKIDGGTSADYLDPLVRPQIATTHAELLPAINALKKGREQAEKLRKK